MLPGLEHTAIIASAVTAKAAPLRGEAVCGKWNRYAHNAPDATPATKGIVSLSIVQVVAKVLIILYFWPVLNVYSKV